MAMRDLATKIWEPRNKNCDSSLATDAGNVDKVTRLKCRLEWVVRRCEDHFRLFADADDTTKLRLLDVGSCYNPFSAFDKYFEVVALDLCPAPGFEKDVFRCDFLKLNIIDEKSFIELPEANCLVTDRINCVSGAEGVQKPEMEARVEYRNLSHLVENSFDIVVFSFFLEYLADSRQRENSCRKAHSLLKPSGLLFVLRPDSNKVTPGGNSRLIKKFKLGMLVLGFKRVYFEKLEHLWCMAFQKLTPEQKEANLRSPFFKKDIQKLDIESIIDTPSRLHELFCIAQDLKEGFESEKEECHHKPERIVVSSSGCDQLLGELPFFDL